MDTAPTPLEIGAWIGKGQVFSLIAKGCTAAQAECLRQIRESEIHKALDLTWEEFCPKHLGCSRATADALIHSLDTLGAAYFRLAEVVRVSPKTYRRIQSSIHGEKIEINGELVPITAENSPRIRSAILQTRADLQSMRARFDKPNNPEIVGLQIRLDACFADLASMVARTIASHQAPSLHALTQYSIAKLSRVARDLEPHLPDRAA